MTEVHGTRVLSLKSSRRVKENKARRAGKPGSLPRWLSRGNMLATAIEEGNRPALEEIRTRIRELRHEIEHLRTVDQQRRLSRQSQISGDAQKQHEARVVRMDEIKEELVKLARGMK